MKRLFKTLLILFVTLILISCNPQKRINRIIKNHPELAIADTIHIADTAITSAVMIDSAVSLEALKDTVIITKEKLEVRLIEINDTVLIHAYHEPDTLIISKDVPVEKIVYQKASKGFKAWWDGFKEYSLVFLVFLVGLLIFVLLRRKS